VYYRTRGALAFGAGVALGAAWGGNWGYGCKWTNGDLNINYNNKYVNNSNKSGNINYGNRPSQQPAGGTWQHNSQHRGGAPYGDRRTANKYATAGTNRSFTGLTAGNPGLNRVGGTGFSNGGGDRISNRNLSPNLGSANAFGSAGFSGNSMHASSNRGNNSFGGAGAGRGARGGGGGGGRRR
jgi:hypothetical protein